MYDILLTFIFKHGFRCPQYRSRGGRFFSASTEDPASADSTDCAGKARASKQRWSGLFGNAKVYCCPVTNTFFDKYITLYQKRTKNGKKIEGGFYRSKL